MRSSEFVEGKDMKDNSTEELILVKPFEWEHWIPLMQLLSLHLAEDGVILDPEEIPEKPEDTPPGSADWDLDHIDQVYLSRSGGFWLAWYGNIPIGHVGAQDLGGVIELRRMYVKAEYRRRGVGTQLVQTLIRHCTAKGVRAIELWTDENGLGHFLYKRLGFCRTDKLGTEFENLEFATGRSSTARPGEIRMRLDLADSDHTK
jgi:GNAT superfamily N-acetyltransferase